MVLKGSSTDLFVVQSKVKVKDKEAYIFEEALNNDSSVLAVSSSSDNIELFALETLQAITCVTGQKKTITGIKFSHQSPNNLYSSSLDGTICLWDIRKQGKPGLTFKDDTDDTLKPLTSFDFNQDEQFICAGSEIVREDAFLIFWDLRTSKLLGGYWNSHTDDITQVKFHPEKSSCMASGSVDGLINIFDLSENCEDDALEQTLNTGSSVGKLRWLPLASGDRISCITHIEEHQLWDIDETKPISVLDRDSLKKSGEIQDIQYLIDVYQRDNQLNLATGTNSGDIHIWSVFGDECALLAKLNGGHNAVVRSIIWNDKSEMLITGGEDGVVCCWRSDSNSLIKPESSNAGKMESHFKSLNLQHNKKPYMKAS